MPGICGHIFMGTRAGPHRCWNLCRRLNIMYPLPCPAVALCMLHWIAIGKGTAWLGKISPGIHVGEALANHPAGPARVVAMPSAFCIDLLPTRRLRCWATNVLDGPSKAKPNEIYGVVRTWGQFQNYQVCHFMVVCSSWKVAYSWQNLIDHEYPLTTLNAERVRPGPNPPKPPKSIELIWTGPERILKSIKIDENPNPDANMSPETRPATPWLPKYCPQMLKWGPWNSQQIGLGIRNHQVCPSTGLVSPVILQVLPITGQLLTKRAGGRGHSP